VNALVVGRAAMQKMLEVINRKPLIDGFSAEGATPDREESVKGRIIFDNVTFAYPSRPDTDIFKVRAVMSNNGTTFYL
jgi:ATP-binding cassette subfamily B (MDR/TAP) protein 1